MSHLSSLALILAVEAILAFIAFRRSKMILVPTGLLIYIMFYQTIFTFANTGIIENTILISFSNGGLYTEYTTAMTWYCGVFLFIFVLAGDLKLPPESEAESGALDAFMQQNLARVNSVATVFLFVYIVAVAIGLDWSVVWSNTTYLAMTDPKQVLAIDAAPFRVGLLLLLPMGIASAGLSGLNLSRNMTGPAIYFGFIALLITVYHLGAHQRGAVIVPGMFAITYGALSVKPRKAIIAVALLLSLYAYPSALIGRTYEAQGLSSITNTFDTFSDVGDPVVFRDAALSNLSEGIFIFTESLDLQASFPLDYKILSFSPLPSFIDGFSALQDQDQVRLNDFTPMSGYAEALKFGTPYLIMLVLYFVLAIRLNKAIARVNRLGFIVVNTFIFLAFFVLNAYPLRNGLKFLLVALGISAAILIFVKPAAAEGSPPPATDVGDAEPIIE